MAENKRSGFIYTKGTRRGFLRMERLGIPRPPFKLEDKITKKLTRLYKDYLTHLMVDFVKEARNANLKIRKGEIVTDSADDLKKALNEAENSEPRGVHNNQTNRAAVQSAMNTLQSKWEQEDWETFLKNNSHLLADTLGDVLDEGIQDFQQKFEQDASPQMSQILARFKLDKKEVFERNWENLKALYFKSSVGRIKGESDRLKAEFLHRLLQYVQGDTDTLDILQTLRKLSKSSARGARFFARDQMQRFNKAQTLANFVSARVKTVKWCTCRDARVRDSHKALDGQIFSINDLPPEIDDYNCRCGLVPVEYED